LLCVTGEVVGIQGGLLRRLLVLRGNTP